MSKHLYLIRHGYAENAKDTSDQSRQLTQNGHSIVRSLGQYLLNKNIFPEFICSSTAIRAKETAQTLVETLNISEQIISFQQKAYQASVRELLEIIQKFSDQFIRIFLVSHNPSISYLAEYLTNASIGSFSPTQFVHISMDLPHWKEANQSTFQFISSFHPTEKSNF